MCWVSSTPYDDHSLDLFHSLLQTLCFPIFGWVDKNILGN
jgi:hypothetical protein